MSFFQIPAPVVTAWATLISAVSTPFVALFIFLMGREQRSQGKIIHEVKEQTDGMAEQMAKDRGKAGYEKGTRDATAVAESTAAALAEGHAAGLEQGRTEQSGRPPLNVRDP